MHSVSLGVYLISDQTKVFVLILMEKYTYFADKIRNKHLFSGEANIKRSFAQRSKTRTVISIQYTVKSLFLIPYANLGSVCPHTILIHTYLLFT